MGRAQAHVTPLHDVSSVDAKHKAVNIISVTEFSYDDPTISYAPLPDHDFDQSPCYPIIAKRESYFCCKLRPGIKNVHLESIEHNIKYKDPTAHKSDLLKCPEVTHEWIIL